LFYSTHLYCSNTFSFSACKKQGGYDAVAPQPLISQLLIPVTLNQDTTVLHLSDFIPQTELIEEVVTHKRIGLELSADKTICTLTTTGADLPPSIILKIKASGHQYSLLLKRSRKINHTFTYFPFASDTLVQVAGDFNGWTPALTPLSLDSGVWKSNLSLNPGKYAYQLVVNGKWMLDPANSLTIGNNMGGTNSLLKLGHQIKGKPLQLFLKHTEGDFIVLESRQFPTNIIAFWNNTDISESVYIKGDEVRIKVPREALNNENSVVRVWGWNKLGAANDVYIPLKKGNVVRSTAELDRNDLHFMSIYFMMVDRFADGDKANNKPIADARIAPRANYQGGDLKGISDKLKEDYFTNLNFNTIWLSPIVQNPESGYVEYPAPHRKYSGYHGYWPVSFTKVDHRFGDDEALKSLVKTAHKKGINILLDFVSNHVHEEHPFYKQHPEYTTPIDLPDGRKNIRLWDEHRLTTWFDTFLPDLDFTQQKVIDMVSDSALFWIQKFGIDGFRHDATKHVSEDFWRALTLKIKKWQQENKGTNVYQIGETFGSRELIGSYVSSGQQDAQFDFNLYFDARSSFLNEKEPFSRLRESLQESFDYYGYHHLMGNITGNHDLPRFISYAGEALRLDEDEKEAGWSRKVSITNPVGYQKLAQLMAFIATIPGVPILYYGDEIGMVGAGDPDNRRMMKFNNLDENEKKQIAITKELMRIRNNNISLIYGDFHWLRAEGSLMAYGRYYLDDAAFVFFNKSGTPKTIVVEVPRRFQKTQLKKHFDSEWRWNQGAIAITIPPYSFEILSTKF
jgi:cyclomaltodextrinase / maltogenic alpha-amylase / neopullulanase